MIIYLVIAFLLIGTICIYSLCKVAGRADEIENEIISRKEN